MTFLSLHKVSFRLPDGRTLFDDINLTFGDERTGIVGRNGVGKSCLVAIMAGTLTPTSGQVSANGTVALMRQLADVGSHETVADLFGVAGPLALVERASAGQASALEVAAADWTLEARIEKALAAVGLSFVEPVRSLASLSGGQRTRAALAALAFSEADFLLLDEPTNNLDEEGRDMIRSFLDGWKGGAAVISHDRALLSGMNRILELSVRGAKIHGGGYEAYRERREAEDQAARSEVEKARRQARQAARAAQQARERQDKRDRAGRNARAGSSDPKILLDARRQRAEATAARGRHVAARLEEEAAQRLASSRETLERITPFAAQVRGHAVAAGKLLLEAEAMQFGFEHGAPLATVDLAIVGPERIVIRGRNGVGKSTLLQTIAGERPALSGSLRVPARLASFDQNVGLLDGSLSILDNYRRLNPAASQQDCRAALARFAFRADAALQRVDTLSGGEKLRAGLACVLDGEAAPELLLLDEPTNHLDLDSIVQVEAGLAEYRGGLLVVSHDEAFVEAVGVERELVLERSSPSLN